MNKIEKGLRQAIDHAKGNPAEGTRETWFDFETFRRVRMVFKNGKWIDLDAQTYSESHLGAALTEGTAARMALLAHVQRDNGCPPTGQYCRDWTKCGCYLEAEEEIKQFEHSSAK